MGNLRRFPLELAICVKAFWPPKSPETTPNPKFSRKSGVAPKSPRNSHWTHAKRHAKPHWIPLNSPEFSRNSPNFPKFAQIPPNPWNFREIRGGDEFTQSANWSLVLGRKCHDTSPVTVVSKIVTDRHLFWGQLISNYRYRILLPEGFISITETYL